MHSAKNRTSWILPGEGSREVLVRGSRTPPNVEEDATTGPVRAQSLRQGPTWEHERPGRKKRLEREALCGTGRARPGAQGSDKSGLSVLLGRLPPRTRLRRPDSGDFSDRWFPAPGAQRSQQNETRAPLQSPAAGYPHARFLWNAGVARTSFPGGPVPQSCAPLLRRACVAEEAPVGTGAALPEVERRALQTPPRPLPESPPPPRVPAPFPPPQVPAPYQPHGHPTE